MIDINYCRELIIEEKEKTYLVKFIDFHNKVRLVEYVKNDVGKKNISDIVSAFLNTFDVNGINKAIPVVRNVNKQNEECAEILLSDNSRKISMRIYNPEFKFINNMALDNYFINRSNFFKDERVKEIIINASSNEYKYEMLDGVVNLTLMTDLNMNIRGVEKEFIRELLENKCFGKRINVDVVFKENSKDKQYVVTCGEFRMIFSTGYTYSTIIGVINQYNDEINGERKRR